MQPREARRQARRVATGRPSVKPQETRRNPMLEIKINGFTIIAHEQDKSGSGYTVLGARRTGPGDYEYVVAWMRSLDDAYWSGSGDYSRSLSASVANYTNRTAI